MRDVDHSSSQPAVEASHAAAEDSPARGDLLQRKIQRRALQRRGQGGGGGGDANVQEQAARGVEGSGGALPHAGAIQQSFGRHDISGIQAHTGDAPTAAAEAIGARAYATGDHVAFAPGATDLHTAAHEAAHVVQQRSGVSLSGGVGREGDPYEQHADQVADAVVGGASAEPILDRMAGGSGGGAGVQRQAVVQRDGAEKEKEKGGAGGKPDFAVSGVSVNAPIIRQRFESIAFTATVENKGAAAGMILRGRLSETGAATPGDASDLDWMLPNSAAGDKPPQLGTGEKKVFTLGQTKLNDRTHTVDKTKQVDTKGKWFPGVTVTNVQDSDQSNNTAFGSEVNIIDAFGNGMTDERMGYTKDAKEKAGKIDGQALPFHNPGSWNAKEILTNWTQVDGFKEAANTDRPLDHTNTDEFRCGPTVAIATAILDGPQEVYGFAWRLGDAGKAKMDAAKDPARKEELSLAILTTIDVLTEVIDMKKGTYGTLSRLGHAAKMIMTSKAGDPTSGNDMLSMMVDDPKKQTESLTGGKTENIGKTIFTRAELEGYIEQLQLNEKYTVQVDTDVRQPGVGKAINPDAFNHWVMIAGVGSKSKKIVLYDPYPREGSQISFYGEDGFWKYFLEPDGKTFRGCGIITKSGRAADVTGKTRK